MRLLTVFLTTLLLCGCQTSRIESYPKHQVEVIGGVRFPLSVDAGRLTVHEMRFGPDDQTTVRPAGIPIEAFRPQDQFVGRRR